MPLLLRRLPLPVRSPTPRSKVPFEAVNQVNPDQTHRQIPGPGQEIYSYECALCHGDDGGGTGDLAKNMKAKMP